MFKHYFVTFVTQQQQPFPIYCTFVLQTHGVRSLTPYLFKVPSHSHLISVVYPDGVSEDELGKPAIILKHHKYMEQLFNLI